MRVEESPDRIYQDSEFKDVGAEIVPAGSWVNAPLDNIILGLKELPADGCTYDDDAWRLDIVANTVS